MTKLRHNWYIWLVSLTILSAFCITTMMPSWAIQKWIFDSDNGQIRTTNRAWMISLDSGNNWQFKGGSLVPSTTAVYNLGTSAKKWKNLYMSHELYNIETGTVAAAFSGAPAADATLSLIQIGGVIANGNSAANGGTYLSVNAPASGAGSAADYANFLANGTSKFKVTSAGNVTVAGTLGVTGTITGGVTGNVTGNVTGDVTGAHNGTVGATTPAAGLFTTVGASDNVTVSVAGKGLSIKEGTNARMGVATLNGAGWVTVSTTAVGATSRVFVTGQTTTGACYVKARVADTSFDIYSTNASDSGNAAWLIVNPAP